MFCKKSAVLLAFAALFCEINCLTNSKSREEQCLDYYKNGETGEIFDLSVLQGDYYTVYFWPPNQRRRDSCELWHLKKLTFAEVGDLKKSCSDLDLPENVVYIKATYKNAVKKLENIVYYGNDEVKGMYRSCDRDISKYLFRNVTDNYVLGINCSAGGRGILFSKTLPNAAEVEKVIEGIEIMGGRQGSPDSKVIQVENECGEIPTIIVQNKIDLMDQCVVGPDEAELVARALGCRLMRVSVKEDVNVGAVFRALAARCLSDMRREEDALPPTVTPFIGSFTNHNSNGTILLRPAKHRPGKKRNVFKNACRIL